MITDERLEYLANRHERYAKAHRATGSPIAGQECEDNAAALRELQKLRRSQPSSFYVEHACYPKCEECKQKEAK